jgi:hypothetical protein
MLQLLRHGFLCSATCVSATKLKRKFPATSDFQGGDGFSLLQIGLIRRVEETPVSLKENNLG